MAWSMLRRGSRSPGGAAVTAGGMLAAEARRGILTVGGGVEEYGRLVGAASARGSRADPPAARHTHEASYAGRTVRPVCSVRVFRLLPYR